MSKASKNQARLIDSSAVGRDGYVRVRPTWRTSQIHQMDAGGFGRQIGWLLGAMITAPIMLLVSKNFAFWQILLGIAIGAILGALIGHVLAKAVWGRLKHEIDAVNPRQVMSTEVTPGSWMMTRNDGTNRAIRIESVAEPTEVPQIGNQATPSAHVRFLTSTGRYVIMPADQEVTLVELAEDVDLPPAKPLA
ncbi:hypothetical protein [Blastococcus sp. Marseille-P5729]|uniref:hypothetical protein n=1 Tax=Blastococcus sp. Marseille-P5729 TaxID=2086582 RepID=UPI000D104CDB|nr:hypothetical protein [Blastococcus sp. Marseille-P5729]